MWLLRGSVYLFSVILSLIFTFHTSLPPMHQWSIPLERTSYIHIWNEEIAFSPLFYTTVSTCKNLWRLLEHVKSTVDWFEHAIVILCSNIESTYVILFKIAAVLAKLQEMTSHKHWRWLQANIYKWIQTHTHTHCQCPKCRHKQWISPGI